jgi:hypothetical protein
MVPPTDASGSEALSGGHVCPFCGATHDRDRGRCLRCEATPVVTVDDRGVYESVLRMCGPDCTPPPNATSAEQPGALAQWRRRLDAAVADVAAAASVEQFGRAATEWSPARLLYGLLAAPRAVPASTGDAVERRRDQWTTRTVATDDGRTAGFVTNPTLSGSSVPTRHTRRRGVRSGRRR